MELKADQPQWSECDGTYCLMDHSGKAYGLIEPIVDPPANWFLYITRDNGTLEGTLQPYGGYVGVTEAMMICEIEVGMRPNTLFVPISKEMEAFEREWRNILDRILVAPKGNTP